MVSPVDQTVSFKPFQSEAEHTLRDAQIPLQLIEAERPVAGQRNDEGRSSDH